MPRDAVDLNLILSSKRARVIAPRLLDPLNSADEARQVQKRQELEDAQQQEEWPALTTPSRKRGLESDAIQSESAKRLCATEEPAVRAPTSEALEGEEAPTVLTLRKYGQHPIVVDSDDEVSASVTAGQTEFPETQKNVPRNTGKPTAHAAPLTAHTTLPNVEVQGIDDIMTTSTREDSTIDIKHFFSDIEVVEGKKKRKCRKCSQMRPSYFVNEATTLRRHMESYHKADYLSWAECNNFESMLPKDSKARREKKKADGQTRLDAHLEEMPARKYIIPYSNELFRKTAIEWLVVTDQPIDALTHPKFQEMINVAARAPDSVTIPGRKQTRNEILSMFKAHLTKLRECMNSKKVPGSVSLTCDAWQASNTDGYFAVTGSWIEEVSEGHWEQQPALLGFVRMNSAHNGQRLGTALYKVCNRLGIAHKIGWVTCDNASNNTPMMERFAVMIKQKTGKEFNPVKRRIRCLAHIVNLATQAFISTYSKSLPYDPEKPDQDLVDQSTHGRDEIGVVRTIGVKARSSSKRKGMFQEIQTSRGSKQPLQLQIDMPIRWSSTFVMLETAEKLRDHIDSFILKLAEEEKDRTKRQKLMDLQLSGDEWERVGKCLNLLAHAEVAQHAFSTDKGPSLHLALPALEKMHKAWSSRASNLKYMDFWAALGAGTAKINSYYEKTAESDAYTFAMLLDPSRKLDHIRKSWGDALLKEALKEAEKIYEKRYKELYSSGSESHSAHHGQRISRCTKKGHGRELSDDEDENDGMEVVSVNPQDSEKPWLGGFNKYAHSKTVDVGNLSIVHWWGINASEYPVWASLALDYLPIMASSVSSEQAFSSAGITITKRRNCLGMDIVEALQFLKSSEYEREQGRESRSQSNETGWDDQLLEDDDDGAEMDLVPDGDDDDDVFLFEAQ